MNAPDAPRPGRRTLNAEAFAFSILGICSGGLAGPIALLLSIAALTRNHRSWLARISLPISLVGTLLFGNALLIYVLQSESLPAFLRKFQYESLNGSEWNEFPYGEPVNWWAGRSPFGFSGGQVEVRAAPGELTEQRVIEYAREIGWRFADRTDVSAADLAHLTDETGRLTYFEYAGEDNALYERLSGIQSVALTSYWRGMVPLQEDCTILRFAADDGLPEDWTQRRAVTISRDGTVMIVYECLTWP